MGTGVNVLCAFRPQLQPPLGVFFASALEFSAHILAGIPARGRAHTSTRMYARAHTAGGDSLADVRSPSVFVETQYRVQEWDASPGNPGSSALGCHGDADAFRRWV